MNAKLDYVLSMPMKTILAVRVCFDYCESIEDINVDSATNVNSMFLKCYNVKYGIIAMYNKLLARGSAITDHTDTFLDCGINTEEGRAERALIPKSWGGDAEG